MLKVLTFFLLIQFWAFPTNAEFELKSESSFAPEFNNRFSIGFGLNPSIGRSQDIKTLSFSYAREWDDNFWVIGSYLLTGIKFSDLAENNSSATNVSTELIEDEAERLNSLGIGVGYSSRYIANLIPFDLYEFTEALVTYSRFSEKVGEESFSGPGFMAKYSVIKPIGNYTHLGLHFDYNLSSFKRAAENDEETSSQRGFSASWMTFGFNVIFFL